DEGLKLLMKVIADPKSHDREVATLVLIEASDRGTVINPAVPLLVTNLMDRDQRVAEAAVTALGKWAIEPEIVVPALTNCMETTNTSLRSLAVFNLKYFGASARSAIPSLEKALSDPDKLIRDNAIRTLNQIAPEVLATNSPAP